MSDAPIIGLPAAAYRSTIHVGVGGWTYAPWRDNFYPSGLPHRRELEFASRHLTAIEVNGTYYGAQKPATYAKWADEVPKGFVFSLKAPRFAVVRKQLALGTKTIDAFVHGGIAELGACLGPLLWQFQPSKVFDASDLAGFLDLLPRDLNGTSLRHVLEVRNASFLCQEYIDLARTHGVATVFTDSPEYPSFANATGDFIYARLVRSGSKIKTGYKQADLKAWATRARIWANGEIPSALPRLQLEGRTKIKEPKPRDVYVHFIGAAKERNPAAAMALIAQLAK